MSALPGWTSERWNVCTTRDISSKVKGYKGKEVGKKNPCCCEINRFLFLSSHPINGSLLRNDKGREVKERCLMSLWTGAAVTSMSCSCPLTGLLAATTNKNLNTHPVSVGIITTILFKHWASATSPFMQRLSLCYDFIFSWWTKIQPKPQSPCREQKSLSNWEF